MAEKVGFEPASMMMKCAKMRFNVRFYGIKAGICQYVKERFSACGVVMGSKN